MNSVNIIGRICNDMEVKYVGKKSDLAVTNINVAIDCGEDDTVFVPVTAFGKTAEFIEDYMKKGQRIGLSGELRLDKWETEDGEKRSKLYVVATRVYFADAKKDDNGSRDKSKGRR